MSTTVRVNGTVQFTFFLVIRLSIIIVSNQRTCGKDKKMSSVTFQNGWRSCDNGIWQNALGQCQKKIGFVKFQKFIYRKLCKNDYKNWQWKCIVNGI